MICPTLRQYVLLGDGAAMTDGQAGRPEPPDDRWVFTEENPSRELTTAAHLAAASRVLKGFNDTLSIQCLEVAESIYNLDRTISGRSMSSKIHAAKELYLTTGETAYRDYIVNNELYIIKEIRSLAWLIGLLLHS